MKVIHGRARRFGDDVNTDYIISSRRKRETIDGAVLRTFLLEAVDPSFAASVRPGDVIVAGSNFGCGSAMEVAATVIVAGGIPAVMAKSFARSFFRNAINNGLLPIECETAGFSEGDQIAIQLDAAQMTVTNQRSGDVLTAAALPALMFEIVSEGGLVPYLKHFGKLRA